MMDVLLVEEDVIDFIKRGANGFIVKDAALEDLVNIIRQVANGGDVVPSALTGTLLSHIAKQASVLRNTPMMASVRDRKSTRLNSSHTVISYAVFCLKKKKKTKRKTTHTSKTTHETTTYAT